MGTSPESKKSTFFSNFQKSIQTSCNHVKTFKRHLKHLKKRSVNLFCTLNSILTPYRALKANSSKSPKTPKIMRKMRFFNFFQIFPFFRKKSEIWAQKLVKRCLSSFQTDFQTWRFEKEKKSIFWLGCCSFIFRPSS